MNESYYEVLGVPESASTVEIRTAYRQRVRHLHPDRQGPAALFRQVTTAYEVLVDPERRAEYDRTRSIAGPPPGSAPPPAPAVPEEHPAGPSAAADHLGPSGPAPRGAAPFWSGSDDRSFFVRGIVGGAYLSVVGFGVLQLIWMIGDDTFEDGLFDEFPWMRTSSWLIGLLAVLTLAQALRLRRRPGDSDTTAAGVRIVISSATLILVFLLAGIRSGEYGVWPAALGAVISILGAVAHLRSSPAA